MTIRRSRLQPLPGDIARGHTAHHRQAGRRSGRVGRTDSIAVHGRIVKRRDVDVGDDLFGQDPAQRLQDRDTLRFQRPDVTQDLGQGLFHTDQDACSSKGFL